MDFLPALSLQFRVILAFFQDGQHPQNPVDGCAQVVRHVGKEFTLCRICLPYPIEKLQNGLLLLFPRHHGFRDVLMISVQAAPRFFKGFVRHAAAADINFSQRWMIPGIDHLGASAVQYFPYCFLYHFHIVRLNAFKPEPVAFLRPNLLRYAQKNPHGSVRIHPWLAAVLQLNRPDAGPGSLENVLQAPPCLQLVFLLLLHQGIDIPLSKNHPVLSPKFLRDGKIHLQVLQPGRTVFHLVADREFLICPELSQHIIFFRHGAEPFLIPWNHIPGNIPLHSCRIAFLKIGGPIHTHRFAASVDFAFSCVEVYLIDTQVVHTEGVEHIIAPLLKLTEQVAPF